MIVIEDYIDMNAIYIFRRSPQNAKPNQKKGSIFESLNSNIEYAIIKNCKAAVKKRNNRSLSRVMQLSTKPFVRSIITDTKKGILKFSDFSEAL